MKKVIVAVVFGLVLLTLDFWFGLALAQDTEGGLGDLAEDGWTRTLSQFGTFIITVGYIAALGVGLWGAFDIIGKDDRGEGKKKNGVIKIVGAGLLAGISTVVALSTGTVTENEDTQDSAQSWLDDRRDRDND